MATPMLPKANLKAPDKGSFPLDHEGECRDFMVKYMVCLTEHNKSVSKCREATKKYLDCRMNKNLMTKEPWTKLGFPEETNNATVNST